MEEIIFKPKYSVWRYITFFVFTIGVIFSFYNFIFKETSLTMAMILIFFTAIMVLIPLTTIKRIIFSEDTFTVVNMILPEEVYNFDDLIEVLPQTIRTNEKNIFLSEMKNWDELEKIFIGLTQEDKIPRRVGDINKISRVDKKTYTLSVIISIVIWIVISNLLPEVSFFQKEYSFLIIVLPVYSLVFWLLNRFKK